MPWERWRRGMRKGGVVGAMRMRIRVVCEEVGKGVRDLEGVYNE